MAGAAPADEDGSRKKAKQGGFKTMPFILANEVCDRFATAGFNANMITYLTQQLHLPLVEASNLLTNFMGTAAFTPVFGAIIADSYAGRYWTIACGGVLYQLGMLGLVLSALIPSLPPRDVQQYRVRRRTVPARQRRAASRALPVAALHRARVRRHPAENVGWGWGFGIPAIAMFVSVLSFVVGYPLYVRVKPGGSPFVRLVHVIVAAIRKRKETVPENAAMLYQNKELDAPIAADGRLLHTNQLRFLDRAAIVTTTDAVDSGTEPNPWRLSTVHRVEELKSIVRMLPLWAASITLIAAASHNFTFAIQQSRTMERRLSPRFEIPPASMIIFTTLTMLVSLSLYDRVFVPVARRYTGRQSGISYFQRMGAGLAVSVLGVLAGALVERKRRAVAADHGLLDSPGATVPISVFWLVPQYALHGVSDALSTVAHMEFLYDQSPESMRSSAAALFWVAGSLGNYLGTVLVTVVQSASGGEWLQDNINRGRLDYYYWLVTFLMLLNLVYYIICFHFYTLKSFEVDAADEPQRQQDGCEDRSVERQNELYGGQIGASRNCEGPV
ncbi:hypothetical protein ACQ4PT_035015 [Festuca glaucescens]